MSGVRRKTKYRKGVEDDVLNSLPELKDGEVVVRVISARGGNLIEVESAEGTKSLCRLPNRYRRVVWVKRGTLLIVDSCSEVYSTAAGEEGKVKYIANHVIFTDDQTKHLRKIGQLPSVFDLKVADSTDADEDDDLIRENRNRRPNLTSDESSSDDDDEAEDESHKGSEQSVEDEEHAVQSGQESDEEEEEN